MRVRIAIALNHFPACGRPYCKPAHLCNIPFYAQAQLLWSSKSMGSARLWNQPMPRFFSQINPCTDQVKVGVSVATQKASEMFQFYSQISEWVLRHGNELGATRKFRSPWLGFVPQHISHHSLRPLLRTHSFFTQPSSYVYSSVSIKDFPLLNFSQQ